MNEHGEANVYSTGTHLVDFHRKECKTVLLPAFLTSPCSLLAPLCPDRLLITAGMDGLVRAWRLVP